MTLVLCLQQQCSTLVVHHTVTLPAHAPDKCAVAAHHGSRHCQQAMCGRGCSPDIQDSEPTRTKLGLVKFVRNARFRAQVDITSTCGKP